MTTSCIWGCWECWQERFSPHLLSCVGAQRYAPEFLTRLAKNRPDWTHWSSGCYQDSDTQSRSRRPLFGVIKKRRWISDMAWIQGAHAACWCESYASIFVIRHRCKRSFLVLDCILEVKDWTKVQVWLKEAKDVLLQCMMKTEQISKVGLTKARDLLAYFIIKTERMSKISSIEANDVREERQCNSWWTDVCESMACVARQ